MAQDVQGQWAHLPGDPISDTEDDLTTPKEFLQLKYDSHVSGLFYYSCTEAFYRWLVQHRTQQNGFTKIGKAIFFLGQICVL